MMRYSPHLQLGLVEGRVAADADGEDDDALFAGQPGLREGLLRFDHRLAVCHHDGDIREGTTVTWMGETMVTMCRRQEICTLQERIPERIDDIDYNYNYTRGSQL